jgi:hypothetical protein
MLIRMVWVPEAVNEVTYEKDCEFVVGLMIQRFPNAVAPVFSNRKLNREVAFDPLTVYRVSVALYRLLESYEKALAAWAIITADAWVKRWMLDVNRETTPRGGSAIHLVS